MINRLRELYRSAAIRACTNLADHYTATGDPARAEQCRTRAAAIEQGPAVPEPARLGRTTRDS